MSIPEIPAENLAKLVLGYLAEEQLMTAYDEFLHTSPYLDAQENEYDRIFMTSLKHIAAEYKALRILVETCQPFALRRKLMQCLSLYDMVQFLIKNVDMQKIGHQSNLTPGSMVQRLSSVRLERDCISCRSINCVCHTRSSCHSSVGNSSKADSMVEATCLTDLPGTNSIRKKKMKVLHKQNTKTPQTSMSHKANEESYQQSLDNQSSKLNVLSKSHLEGSVQNACNLSTRMNQVLETIKIDSAPKINPVINNKACNSNIMDKRMSVAGTFNDFASGVASGTQVNVSIPDSSTTDNFNNQFNHRNTNRQFTAQCGAQINYSSPSTSQGSNSRKLQYLLQVTKSFSQTTEAQTLDTITKPKEDHKVTILSDVKVDQESAKNVVKSNKPPTVTQTATSTPVMQMQVINPNLKTHQTFTNEEIMSMPTIFLVPALGQSSVAPNQVLLPALNTASSVRTTSSTSSLEPLTIDVSNSHDHKLDEIQVPVTIPTSGSNYVSMLDVKNASVPKDNIVTLGKTSTPQVLPPTRKSSSTPRRTSHVRVLDFTTPRRILHETINEHGSTRADSVEVLVSKSPSLSTQSQNDQHIITNTDSALIKIDDKSTKENQITPLSNKRRNWDADLRASLLAENNEPSKPKPQKKKRKSPEDKPIKRNKSPKKSVSKSRSTKKTISPKKISKKRKRKSKDDEDNEQPVNQNVDLPPIKPTINVISGWNGSPPKETDKSDNKSNSEVQSDTPDMDRISLQNAIGAKLNISDLLETPYKQALYDIQMETPRFLQPDIPGEPVSDIKINDIPTPRFLVSGTSQATPSSYCSRPTDYSSGGSYYKPDDHDYAPISDLDFMVTNLPDKNRSESTGNNSSEHKKVYSDSKPSRPVRQCTKNVSYCDSKSKTIESKADADSSTDSTDLNVSCETNEESNKSSAISVKEQKTKTKADTKKRSNVKPRRSSTKKSTPNKFMKIKPRRPTPTKLNRNKIRREVLASSFSKSPRIPSSKRTSNKEKSITEILAATPAPTKSRRKSSTPRKIHTKVTIMSSDSISPTEIINRDKEMPKFIASCARDSDTEQLPLRWSDDGSRQSSESNRRSPDSAHTQIELTNNVINTSSNEIDEISKIKEYIERTIPKCSETPNVAIKEDGVSLHIDLVKRGFDIETAKIIERDLLDADRHTSNIRTNKDDSVKILDLPACYPKSPKAGESDVKLPEKVIAEKLTDLSCTSSTNLEIEEVEEIDLSVYECTEESKNYEMFIYSDDKEKSTPQPSDFKETYSMEICLFENEADGKVILRMAPEIELFELEPRVMISPTASLIETEAAVNSISNIDKLYTPMKVDRATIEAQCIEIFDSTLTSLDTPLKVNSPKRSENITISEIVLEVEQVIESPQSVSSKEKSSKKRKRFQSGSCSDESLADKKAKREPRLVANIQNFDIESVLSKLHGP